MEITGEMQTALFEYNRICSNNDASLAGPIVDAGVYYENNHKKAEALRVIRDMALVPFVKILGDKIHFLKICEEDGKINLVYNGFPKTFNIPGIDLVPMPALSFKNKGKFYNLSTKVLKWWYMAMEGDINVVYTAKIGPLFDDDTYLTNYSEFVKKVANLIKFNPHKEYDTYAGYVFSFMEYFKKCEDNELKQCAFLNTLIEELHSVFHKDQREKKTIDELNDEVMNKSTIKLIQDCSTTCHKELKKINYKSEIAISGLQKMMLRGKELKEEAMLKRRVNQAPLGKILSVPSVQEVEKMEDAERNPKIRRTDVVDRPTIISNPLPTPDIPLVTTPIKVDPNVTYTEEDKELAEQLLPDVPLQ